MTVIPLGDASRHPLHRPVVTGLIVLVNVLAFALELTGGESFVMRWSVIPADILAGRHWSTLLTGMFLHASWSHLIGNMVFLWTFGPQIEDAMGALRYGVFYLLAGVAATLAQVAVTPDATIPHVGASGAIAAVMGAFLITYPRHPIRTLLVFFVFVRIAFIPAAVLIGLWFLSQLVSLGTVATAQSGGIAYVSHVSGVLFGVLTGRWFEAARSRVSPV